MDAEEVLLLSVPVTRAATVDARAPIAVLVTMALAAEAMRLLEVDQDAAGQAEGGPEEVKLSD